jgi:hypothetical protein
VAKGFAHIEGKSIFGGKLGYLNSGFVKQMGLEKVSFSLFILLYQYRVGLESTFWIEVKEIIFFCRKRGSGRYLTCQLLGALIKTVCKYQNYRLFLNICNYLILMIILLNLQ